jgi:Cof subfamily protein (haloacid dehalogenase superfamily)
VPASPAYALLVSDIDGTLVADSKAVSPGVVEAVRAARARGVRVCLATGRMWQATRPFVEAIGADPPAILYNGAVVYDFVSDRTLWTARLPRDAVRRILPLIRSVPRVSPQLYVHGGVFAERMNPYVELYARRERLAVAIESDFDRLLTEDPVKILIVGERADLQALSRALAALPDTPVNQVFSQQDYLEILPANVSKGVALPVLTGAARVPLDRTVAVGDNLNDLTMLQRAGMGVAVEGSPPELLAAADWVCPPPEREGVRVLIERVFLSRDG